MIHFSEKNILNHNIIIQTQLKDLIVIDGCRMKIYHLEFIVYKNNTKYFQNNNIQVQKHIFIYFLKFINTIQGNIF